MSMFLNIKTVKSTRSGIRTRMASRPRDFESRSSTSSDIQAIVEYFLRISV